MMDTVTTGGHALDCNTQMHPRGACDCNKRPAGSTATEGRHA